MADFMIVFSTCAAKLCDCKLIRVVAWLTEMPRLLGARGNVPDRPEHCSSIELSHHGCESLSYSIDVLKWFIQQERITVKVKEALNFSKGCNVPVYVLTENLLESELVAWQPHSENYCLFFFFNFWFYTGGCFKTWELHRSSLNQLMAGKHLSVLFKMRTTVLLGNIQPQPSALY